MKVGIIVPQGWTGEYDGWDASRAWARTVALAHGTETLGFDSIWLFDHVQTEPVPTDEITFEAVVALSALAGETARVRLGHLVLCAGYRNPALVAKMIATLDVVSGGRAELGLGAGWKEDEYLAYGFGFPPLRERMAALEDALKIATRMLAPGRATYAGLTAAVRGAINVPRGLQEPRIPILVGGTGPNRTWRLAARF
ncbi:MAG: LLM class flavin-dependent oxidoreductase, partial [Chloroflexota bacterium]|nr:LLM class flavin-dependent oxidoreductase [Chloroflexota bacterium]